MAFTVLCYYVLNARQSCKPGGLYALWRDKIPAPSNSFLEEQEYIAHALSIWDKKQNEIEVLKLNEEKNNEDNFIYGKETENKENENNNDETNGDNNETQTQQKEKEKEKDKNGEVKTVALSQPGTTAIEMELIQSQKDDMSKSQSQPQAPATRREKNEQNLQLTFDFWSNRGKSAGVINVPALDRIMSIPLDGVGRGRAGSRGRGSSVNRGRGGTINRNSSLARSGSQLTKQETKFFEAVFNSEAGEDENWADALDADQDVRDFLRNVKQQLKVFVSKAKDNMTTDDKACVKDIVNFETNRVYSDFGNYTYRLVTGFTFKTVAHEDDVKYQKYWTNKDKKQIVIGYGELYKDQFFSILSNYEQYWLDLYRPYDEYEIDRNLSETHFMYGFQCWKRWLNTRSKLMRKEKKKHYTKHDGYLKKCTKGTNKVCGWTLDHICDILLLILAILAFMLIYYFQQTLTGDSSYEDSVGTRLTTDYNSSNTSNVSESDETSFGQRYPLCDTLWQDTEKQTSLSAVDVVILNTFVYQQDDYDLNQMVNRYFDGEFEVLARRDVEPFFFHMRHKKHKLDYIVIRGSSSVADYLQDVSLFIEVTFYQMLSWVFPFLNAMPTSFVRTIVAWASTAEGIINREARSRFSDIVFNYAHDYLNELNYSTSFYISGFSLGGAVSAVVASKLYETNEFNDSYISSLAVNSPGTLYSSAKFGFAEPSLRATSVSILAERDVITMIDLHSGTIQEVDCEKDFFYECHKIDTAICEMFSTCPLDTARYPTVVDKWCYEPGIWDRQLGAILGVDTLNTSNFTISYEEPVQYLSNYPFPHD